MGWLRVFRLFHIVKAIRFVNKHPYLDLLISGFIGSMKAMFFGGLIIAALLCFFSILVVQILHPINADLTYDACSDCSGGFHSIGRSMLTLFQQIIAGDSWRLSTIPLIEIHPATSIFFAAVFLSVGLALMSLILGVVVTQAQQAHDDLRDEMRQEAMFLKREAQMSLIALCEAMDDDGSGDLSKDEIIAGYKSSQIFRDCVSTLGLEEEDLNVVWTLVDPAHCGKCSYKEFVQQLYTMQSSDTQFVLAYMKYYLTDVRKVIVDKLADAGEQQLAHIRHTVAMNLRLSQGANSQCGTDFCDDEDESCAAFNNRFSRWSRLGDAADATKLVDGRSIPEMIKPQIAEGKPREPIPWKYVRV